MGSQKGMLMQNTLVKGAKANGFFGQGFFFVLPGLIGFCVFFIFPFCLSLVYAFMDKPVGGSFAGFANFRSLFVNRAYLRGLLNTIRFIGISTPLNWFFHWRLQCW